jgi:hypothetical protein
LQQPAARAVCDDSRSDFPRGRSAERKAGRDLFHRERKKWFKRATRSHDHPDGIELAGSFAEQNTQYGIVVADMGGPIADENFVANDGLSVKLQQPAARADCRLRRFQAASWAAEAGLYVCAVSAAPGSLRLPVRIYMHEYI